MLILVPISTTLVFAILAVAYAVHTQQAPLVWAAMGAGFGLALVLPFRAYRIGSLNLDLADELRSDAVLQSKPIAVPGFRRAYNPSLLSRGDGYVLSFRVKHHNVSAFFRKLVNVRTSYVGLVALNSRFEVVGKPDLLRLSSYADRPSHTAQDARLIHFGGKVLMFFNDFGATGDRASCAIYVAVLNEGNEGWHAEGRAMMLSFEGMAAVEKNWVPFVADEQLYLVYSAEPHCVLRPDLDTGVCEVVASTDTTTSWRWGTIRGGTPAAHLGNGMLTFFHSSQIQPAHTLFGEKRGRSYAMGAYLFDSAPPFAIKGLTPALGAADCYANNRRKVVFPGGLVVTADEMHVVWGKNDSEMHISSFSRTGVLSSLTPITPTP